MHWEDPEGWGGEGGGRGIGMGNTCKSMADSCQCMTKPTLGPGALGGPGGSGWGGRWEGDRDGEDM